MAWSTCAGTIGHPPIFLGIFSHFNVSVRNINERCVDSFFEFASYVLLYDITERLFDVSEVIPGESYRDPENSF